MTAWNIILNFSRKEKCLENDFRLINEYSFISGNYLTFSPFYGVMSEFFLSLSFLVRVLITICFLPIHLINLEGFSISMFVNFVYCSVLRSIFVQYESILSPWLKDKYIILLYLNFDGSIFSVFGKLVGVFLMIFLQFLPNSFFNRVSIDLLYLWIDPLCAQSYDWKPLNKS